ncbi:MAG TPA: ABC transporter permease subunit [Fimbriimonadaceae bacterium]|nr:ABC transporter permease subunit [Fimbriimonadaceae bacterium]
MSASAWVRESIGTYLGNATAVRDYRVQLRGNRAVILWAVYLAVLIGFGMLTYSSAASRSMMSVVEAQASLKDFYSEVLNLLSAAIALVAPALTATAIVAERQRKSLDLVFSAPVTPKYYLIGKMISSYRYVWMLLVLSLPVTAACVVLGGAVWSEVLTSYALISLQGLIYTSLALFFSTLAQKPVGAIVWSYISVFIYVWFISGIGMGLAEARHFSFSSGAVGEMPFVVCLSAFQITDVASTYTVIAGYHVPNWILTALFALLFVRLMLLAGSSALSPYGSWETKSLRLHSLAYAFLLSIGLASLIGPLLTSPGSMSSGSPIRVDQFAGSGLIWLLTSLILVLPFITCYGVDLERKYWPDGVFDIRRMLMATPSGGLPFLLALVLAVAAGLVVDSIWTPSLIGAATPAYLYFGLAFVFAAWSVGRLASAFNNGLRYARTLHFAILVLVLFLPLPLLAIADPFGMSSSGSSVWDLYVLRPALMSNDGTGQAWLTGTVLLVVGAALVYWERSMAKKKNWGIEPSYG